MAQRCGKTPTQTPHRAIIMHGVISFAGVLPLGPIFASRKARVKDVYRSRFRRWRRVQLLPSLPRVVADGLDETRRRELLSPL